MSQLIPANQCQISLPYVRIAELCRKYDVEQLDVFGSVLRHDFGSDSDMDFLVIFKNNDYGPWAGKLMDLESDLADVLGREVDLVPRRSVENSENYLRRKHILEAARTIYAA